MSTSESDKGRTRAPRVTLEDAAHLLGVSRRTVERRIQKGELAAERVGKTWLVTLPEREPTEADALRASVRALSDKVGQLSADSARLTRALSEAERERDHARERSEDLERALADARAERDRWASEAAMSAANLQTALAQRLLPERATPAASRWRFWRR